MSRKDGISRLVSMRENCEAVGEIMSTEAARFDTIRGDKPRAVSAFNLFQTPDDIADDMAQYIINAEGVDCTVLEPSAGLGALYRALRRAGHVGKIILIEQAPQCCKELFELIEDDANAQLLQGDFLAREVGAVDCVIMNPPFKMGRDVKHIMQAKKWTKGIIIALCYNGVKQNKILRPMADQWEVLPEGSFKSAGTNASVCLGTF